MEESFIATIGILIGAVLLFIAPLTIIADRADDISQLSVQTFTTEFVDKVIKTGTITSNDYQNYLSALNTTGNTYQVDIELKILDENTAQRETGYTKAIGQNAYYSLYTSQIEAKLEESEKQNAEIESGKIVLKEGDIISVMARNNSKTISQSLKSVYFTIKGEDLHIIAGSGTGIVAVNGAT